MLLETKGLTSDIILTTLAIPSTLIGGRDVERDKRLRLDGLELRAKMNRLKSEISNSKGVFGIAALTDVSAASQPFGF
ncbi:hypothetical protein Tco_0945408 [Tanacetum coccineum]